MRPRRKFDFTDVCNALCDKLIRRHPHIFGEVEAKTAEDVKKNWEEIKLQEGKKHTVLSGVPSSLPAMIKAYRIQDKARGVGFDWDKRSQVWDKVQEELGELQVEVRKMDELKANASEGDAGEVSDSAKPDGVLARQQERVLSELGDVFFALINYARFLKLNPEDALEHTNRKFIQRFTYMEEQTIQKGKSLHDMTLEEMDVRPSWRRVIKRRVITGNLLHCLRAADSVMNSSASRMQSRVYSGYAEAQPALAAKQQQSTLPRPHPRRLRILPVLTRRSWAGCGRCFIGGLRSVEALKFDRSDAAGGVLPGD